MDFVLGSSVLGGTDTLGSTSTTFFLNHYAVVYYEGAWHKLKPVIYDSGSFSVYKPYIGTYTTTLESVYYYKPNKPVYLANGSYLYQES